jgi:hypothetical protein
MKKIKMEKQQNEYLNHYWIKEKHKPDAECKMRNAF